jgi:maltose/moltooligosaccharide transporter
MMGISYIMVASMVPKERSGVYLGIVNMTRLVPNFLEPAVSRRWPRRRV